MNKILQVRIVGVTPLLMNNPTGYFEQEQEQNENLEKGKVATKKGKMPRESPQVEAEKRAYRKKDGNLYIPAVAIYKAILRAASRVQIKTDKGKTISASSTIAGTMAIVPDQISLGTKKYEIDERLVVIQQMGRKPKILRRRPKLEKWDATFNILYDDEWVKPEIIKELLVEAGQRVGILDGRPECKMWFGTFKVNEMKEVKSVK
jgi:hypothetical protein